MPNLIACRILSYGNFMDRGWSHLPEIGIRHVEIPVPPPIYREAVRKHLRDHGVQASSLQALVDISRTDAAELMKPQLETCASYGAKICFVSVKAGDNPLDVVYERLRAIGDVAARLGVVVAMETHPDLMSNGEVARRTIEAVNHPNVRVNFDTANVYYYNENIDGVAELKKVADLVTAIHLKDTSGGYKEWNFPTLGEGVVDFPAVFKLMAERGFTGPYTMELEGVHGVELDEPGQLKMVADSLAYLRKIGAAG